jgi:glycosyltransferase involved in cell wall biosynthesis
LIRIQGGIIQLRINVIIPAYNSESTIEKAIKSAIELNKYVDTRVVVIDDGSTDKTYTIAESYKKQIVLLRNKGKGVSSARNEGLEFLINEKTEDEWITFLDADDVLVEDAFKEISTRKYNSFEYINFCFKEGTPFISETISSERASYYAIKSLKNKNYNFNSPWGRVLKLDFIKKYNLKFDENLSYKEDMLFNIQCFKYMPRIITLQNIGYEHVNSESSVINNFIPSALSDEKYIYAQVKKMFMNKNKLEEMERLVGTIGLTFVYVFPKNTNSKILLNGKKRFYEVRKFLGHVEVNKAFKELNKIDFTIIILYKFGLYRFMKLLFKMKGRI